MDVEKYGVMSNAQSTSTPFKPLVPDRQFPTDPPPTSYTIDVSSSPEDDPELSPQDHPPSIETPPSSPAAPGLRRSDRSNKGTQPKYLSDYETHF